ncbi:hypothetical protein QBC35DRAFT_90520 [Podospora australis]|uniref:Uncharacterized protein n=1 Tax=Podospora australis TaxID=1536484 RepID=A0AAN7AF98_9PEZI|nr:hypothetical protein QBC35DRAFT_90520 [Podospora australis]
MHSIRGATGSQTDNKPRSQDRETAVHFLHLSWSPRRHDFLPRDAFQRPAFLLCPISPGAQGTVMFFGIGFRAFLGFEFRTVWFPYLLFRCTVPAVSFITVRQCCRFNELDALSGSINTPLSDPCRQTPPSRGLAPLERSFVFPVTHSHGSPSFHKAYFSCLVLLKRNSYDSSLPPTRLKPFYPLDFNDQLKPILFSMLKRDLDKTAFVDLHPILTALTSTS